MKIDPDYYPSQAARGWVTDNMDPHYGTKDQDLPAMRLYDAALEVVNLAASRIRWVGDKRIILFQSEPMVALAKIMSDDQNTVYEVEKA